MCIGNNSNFYQSSKTVLIFTCSYLREIHTTEQAAIVRVLSSGTHFTAESTEAMRIIFFCSKTQHTDAAGI